MIRESFAREWLEKRGTKSALCRKYGISRPTGDLWIARFMAGETMGDRSHAPLHIPNKTPPAMVAKILAARAAEPALGATKIKRMLENSGEADVPCMSTINAVLHAHRLITPEASAKATPHVRFQKAQPNEMWQCDFKGHYAAADGTRIHPLSLIDDCSRFCLSADAKTDERYAGVKASFECAFQTYGLPETILCDNGNPWGNAQTSGFTHFEVWLMEQGVLTIHIRARCPQTQGKVERFNGSFKQERLKFRMPASFEDAVAQRIEYRDFYNSRRPHHALNLDTPGQHYRPSPREYAEKVASWDYGNEYEIRQIKETGYLTFGGQAHFLSEALGGKEVALRPSSHVDGVFNLYFRQFSIARLSLKEKAFVRRKAYRIDGDPRNSPDSFRFVEI